MAEGPLPAARPGRCSGRVLAAILFVFVASGTAPAQGIRDRTRPSTDRTTAVTPAQADELTLTLTEVSIRSIQVWVRTGGAIDASRRTVTSSVSSAEGARVSVGQRVRAFPPESISSIYQARVSRVVPQGDHVVVEATLTGPGRKESTHYVLEIVTDAGSFLSVPNDAIIATEGANIVYLSDGGRYTPREIEIGVQGEQYTQVLGGVVAGDQVVTVGSFFIDADRRLKGW